MLPQNPMTSNLPIGARIVIFMGQWLMAFIAVAVIITVLISIMGDWWRQPGPEGLLIKSLLISFPMVIIMSTVNPRWARYIARKWPR